MRVIVLLSLYSRKNARFATMEMNDPLAPLVARHRGGESVGITSVCSANPLVLEATMREAAGVAMGPGAGAGGEPGAGAGSGGEAGGGAGSAPGGLVLVEATSNQVNQDGGYTGMRPPEFRALALGAARAAGLAPDRVLLGGDHLGPNPWRERPAEEAMALAEELVRGYAAAGFTKIHLDCSMACGDDPSPPGDALVSERAARLARVAEQAADGRPISYVIGTEVPVPGGAAGSAPRSGGPSGAAGSAHKPEGPSEHLEPTSAEAARATLRAHREAFARAGLDRVWPRVRGLVVQPGVEFDEWSVAEYAPERTRELQRVLDGEPGIVFEAHSTDYQGPGRLAALVRDHWAILKVGPGLTFALREALFALEAIERELCPEGERSNLRAVLERRMLAEPGHWERYYSGDEPTRRLARAYSFSDRLRYYWPDPAVDRAVRRLLWNLEPTPIPLPMLSAWLPLEYARVRAGELAPEPRALVLDHVAAVLRGYRRACEPLR
jgi:D-tagatose-1,6-bisphosphate aldolase subunit GatZ/KbaZ